MPASQSGTTSSSFLDGLRVVEVTGALAGPYCTTILSDLGAEVIKVEPVAGDSLRSRVMGPDRLPLPFDLVHRGKRSIAVDLKSPEGRDIVRKLAGTCAVFVENFRVGALGKLGLGYEDLRDAHPDLVYCSISGFGQNGPMRDAKGVDLIAQAYSGLLSVTGSEDGQLAKAGFPVSDIGAGMWAAIGILAALARVRRGDGGTHVDVALADSVAAWSLWEIADYVATGEAPGPLGTAHRLVAPYQAFECADGRTLVIGAADRTWKPMEQVLEIDVDDDPRFVGEYQRFLHRRELAGILQERFATAPRDEWMARLRAAGVPCGPVNTIADIVTDEHYAQRGLFVRDKPRFRQPVIVNTPIVADGAPRARGPAPLPGEQTESLLKSLGYDQVVIDELLDRGVVGAPAGNSAPQ